MADKNSFIIRHENIEQLEMLSPAQRGELFLALCYYSRDGESADFADPLVKMLFSVMRGQIARDIAKYEETCRVRSETGKRGGAPVGNQNAAKRRSSKQPKQAKQPDPVCVPDPVPDPDPVCEPVCDPVPENQPLRGASHTAHTAEELTVDWVLQLAAQQGYSWTPAEAQRFIDYNRDCKRTDGWTFAVNRWEENRIRLSGRRDAPREESPDPDMLKYLTLVNRFKEDEPPEPCPCDASAMPEAPAVPSGSEPQDVFQEDKDYECHMRLLKKLMKP